MKKRMMALLLTMILAFNMEAETLYAMEGVTVSQQYGTEEEPKTVSDGKNDPDEEDQPGEPSGEEDQSGENSGEENDQEDDAEKKDPRENDQQEEKYYTITFDLSGGQTETGETAAFQQVKEGELPDSAAVVMPVRTGYQFQGWTDAAGNYYNFDCPILENITLTAAWMPITYRVKFDGNGGTGQGPGELVCTYDEEKELPMNKFYRKGYVFNGWKLENGGTYKEGSSVKNLADKDGAVVILKAVWERGQYKVRFEANGGTGTMNDQVFTCGKSRALLKNRYVREGYTFVGWNTRKDGKGKTYANKQKVGSLSEDAGGIVVLFAMWKGVPYKVKYNGNGASSGTVKSTSHVYGTKSKLSANHYKRKGYTFVGWNTRKDGKGKTYKSGAQITKLTAKKNKTVTLYAKWQAVKYTITYDTKGGKMAKSSKKTYTIATKTFTLPRPAKKGYDFDGWYREKNYKKRIGEIKQGRTGNLKLYAKWVKCTGKAKKTSAKLSTCKAVSTGKVKIQASIKKRVASSDDYYYLVYVNPMNKKIYKMASKTYKKKKITFSLKTSENQGYATSMFGIAVKKKGKYHLISTPSYVKNPEKAAKNKMKYKPGKTKKGIQYSSSMEEIYACGAKQNFLNITVSMVCNNGTIPYQYNGKTYYFNQMSHYQQIVMDCNKKNINVTMQILLDWTEGQTDLIAARARVPGAAPFYTWNVTKNSSREKMEAIFCYLGMVFGKKNCYVSNWVLGNEVNNPNGWNYRGGMSDTAYFKAYAYAFRALYYGIRSQYSNAHIFICTDNYWNTSVPGGYTAKKVITSFTKQLDKIQKGLNWNLAYHAYSFPLTYTNFWDGFGITNDIDTPCITMKNLNVLTSYIKKKYGSSVRIILSEQGYSSTWGEANQAAAIAYSYYIAACNPMIDAFIIRSYSDNPVEAAQGLHMGIAGKEAFKVYKYMDTSKSTKYTKKYLKLIGAKSWKKSVPGFKKERLKKMYRKT